MHRYVDLVKDTEATFLTNLDRVEPLRPEDTDLVYDVTPSFRGSRLYLESVLRKTPIPATITDLTVGPQQLLNELEYQKRATHRALTGLRPRLLIADAVGLGKTLEVGMILSELVRRGRGDRILVVTPRHILEQFRHELWTRFAIPLVRLDSEGIQRVRRKIPANRNPFAFYKRVIISIDTLKNAGRYRHHLEGIRWDAVVIDEFNLVNRATLNNQLARVLAPRTEALLLTSATPHNGDPESFAELVRLLDPTAIADPNTSGLTTSPTCMSVATRARRRWRPRSTTCGPTARNPNPSPSRRPQLRTLCSASWQTRGPTLKRGGLPRRGGVAASSRGPCSRLLCRVTMRWPKPLSIGARVWPRPSMATVG